MNEIPAEILTQLPVSAVKYAPHVWIALFVIRRLWANWKAGNGWYGFKKALVGEKTVEAKAIDALKDEAKTAQKRATQSPFES
jgi:hypothetical protein